MILTSSGTSVLETVSFNIVNPDDHFVVIVSGAFGNRFKQIAETYYKNVHIYNVEWGQSIDIKEFITYLNNLNHQISAVFTQFCETSTAVLHPVGELGKNIENIQSRYLLCCRWCESCIGAVDVNLERDYIDVLVSGGQKQLCCHLV